MCLVGLHTLLSGFSKDSLKSCDFEMRTYILSGSNALVINVIRPLLVILFHVHESSHWDASGVNKAYLS